MQPSSSDIDAIADAIEDAAHAVIAAYDESGRQAGSDEVTPDLLTEALRQYVEILRKLEGAGGGESPADTGGETIFDTLARAGGERAPGEPVRTGGGLDPNDATQLGEYGLGLLHDLAEWANRLGLADVQQKLLDLSVPVALWVARHGGELNSIETLVNTLARMANQSMEPARLREIAGIMGEVVRAASPAIKQDLDQGNPARPWRVLNLNRAIVATRAHDVAAVEAAYADLCHLLPADAPDFFAEGMKQMEAGDFPDEVKDVVRRYFSEYSAAKMH